MYLGCLLFTWQIDWIFCSFTPEIDSNSENISRKRKLSDELDYKNRCQICQFNGTDTNIDQDSLSNKKRMCTQNGSSLYTDEIHECSLIQLMNCAQNNEKLAEYLSKPKHLCCSLFLITMYSNFNNLWRLKFSKALALKLELYWLRKVIVKVWKASKDSNSTFIMKINNKSIHQGTTLNSEEMTDNIYTHLPKFAKDSITSRILSLNLTEIDENNLSTTINPITLADMLSSSYLFYSNFHKNISAIVKAYNSPEDKKMIVNDIRNKIDEIYKETSLELMRKDSLKPIFIMHIIQTKRLMELSDETFHHVTPLVKNFINNPTLDNFRKLFYNIANHKQTENRCLGHFQMFIKNILCLVKKSREVNHELMIKAVDLLIARVILLVPYKHMPLLCYILFKEDIMKHFSTWMIFRHTCIIKRLLLMKQKGHSCNFEKSRQIQSKSYWMNLSFGSYNDLCKDIRNSFIQLHNYKDFQEIGTWDEEAAQETYKVFEQISKVVIYIVNIQNEMNATLIKQS